LENFKKNSRKLICTHGDNFIDFHLTTYANEPMLLSHYGDSFSILGNPEISKIGWRNYFMLVESNSEQRKFEIFYKFLLAGGFSSYTKNGLKIKNNLPHREEVENACKQICSFRGISSFISSGGSLWGKSEEEKQKYKLEKQKIMEIGIFAARFAMPNYLIKFSPNEFFARIEVEDATIIFSKGEPYFPKDKEGSGIPQMVSDVQLVLDIF